MKQFIFLVLCLLAFSSIAQDSAKIVQFEIREQIAPSATRITHKALQEAKRINADLVIIDMNTFGGLLNDGDSIRRAIMRSDIPVWVFIDKNAASAGALISIACDKIFMAPGSTMGSASVVDQDGKLLPDKYQSYMRGIMRATAESHGKDTMVWPRRGGTADTTYVFKRNPLIAEGMVDERTVIEGLVDSTKIVAFTPSEAVKWGYCEGEYNTIEELLEGEGLQNSEIVFVAKNTMDKIIGFLNSPGFRGALIMIMFWGIVFEIRTPGVGFPLAASVLAAMLYFGPLYIEGLAANWEILLFIAGIILIALEIFVVPGFGISGISGITLVVGSLILSMVRNDLFDFTWSGTGELTQSMTIVLTSLFLVIVGIIIFGRGMLNSRLFKKIVHSDTLASSKAGATATAEDNLVGVEGECHSDLRPMGTIKINDEFLEATTYGGHIHAGEKVKVIGLANGVLIVEKV
jgi:membrane-bound serine protease (ClpP class)